jgi:hypothetical protein
MRIEPQHGNTWFADADIKAVSGEEFYPPQHGDQVTWHYECAKCGETCDVKKQLGEDVGDSLHPKVSNSSEKSNSSKEETEKKCVCRGRYADDSADCDCTFSCTCHDVIILTPQPESEGERILELYRGKKQAEMLNAKPVEFSFDFIDALLDAQAQQIRQEERKRMIEFGAWILGDYYNGWRTAGITDEDTAEKELEKFEKFKAEILNV